MARRASEPATVVSQKFASGEEERSANLDERCETGGGAQRRVKRLPYLSDLLRHRPHGPDYYGDTDAGTPCTASPAVDRWDAIKRGAIRYGELQKTSFNHGSDKPHGLANKRLFRLTEDAIEYYHVYFGQVRTDARSFPLTSIESIEREVPGNNHAFRLIFKKFIMELEASSPHEADAWIKAITEQWKQWQETGTLKRDNTASESVDEDRSIPLQPFGNEPFGNGAPRKTPRKPPREITTILEEEEPPAAPPSTAGKKKSRRPRSFSAGTKLFAAQPSEDAGSMDHKRRKSIRRKLRLAPKLEKHAAIVKTTEEEEMQHKKLHEDYAMIKYPRRHWWAIPAEKIFKIDKDNLQIMWRRHLASSISLKSNLALDSVLEVRLGQETSGFNKFPYEEMDRQSFSLIYEGMRGKYAHLESLDLICDHKDHFEEWVKGLDTLQVGPVTNMFPRRYENTDPILPWLKRYWTAKHAYHELDEKAAFKMTRRLDPNLAEDKCKRFVREAHLNQSEPTMLRGNALKWDGFVLLYSLLCAETGRLYEIFREYAITHKRLGMTLEEFQKFLIEECHWTPEQCCHRKVKELMTFHDFHHRAFKKYTSDGKADKWKLASRLLSYAGFLSFLRSKHNAAVNPLHNTVYQEMNRPLSHYFINSSHNTYLEADQIYGKSTLDAYARALLHGCRCIEIDCWDNSVGKEPIVYHGYTFTTKLPLRDILHVIKHYAFQMSHYPLIISIENHCSSEQQATMARMFVEELIDSGKSMLPDKNLAMNELFWRRRLPSPEELQGKILLKGSFKSPEQTAKMRKGMSKVTSRALIGRDDVQLAELDKDLDANAKSDTRDRPSIHSHRASFKEARRFQLQVESGQAPSFMEDDQELSYMETAPDLDKLIVYCRSTRLKPWNWDKQRQTNICQMFSFGENSAENLCKKNGLEMLACAERQLVRTYPKGSRIDSSNYCPIMFWNHGIHMAALNYQYPDIHMHLNQGKFRQNGGCGYILKPKVMRTTYSQRPDKQFDPNMTTPHPDVPTCLLEISLLSGQNLTPLGKTASSISVTISTHGIPADCTTMDPKPEASSPFWPQWPKDLHTVQHRILMPELCLVYFRVDSVQQTLGQTLGSSQLLGQNCIPLSSLQPGIKFIQLRKAGGALIPESGLFVQIKKMEDLEVSLNPRASQLRKQDNLDTHLDSIDPTQAIVPSEVAQLAHNQPNKQSNRKSRPRLRRQSEEEDPVNPFDFTPAIAAAASIEKPNGNLKADNSFDVSEVQFEADVTVHQDSSTISSTTSDSAQSHAAPSGSGHVTLVVIPTKHSDNAVSKETAQHTSESEPTTPLVPKEES